MSSVQEAVCLEVHSTSDETSSNSVAQPKTNSDRNKVLDALRGIAILLVLGRHTLTSELWNKVGWSGVDLFFVLSGFLISGLLFQEFKRFGNLHLKSFWVRRGFKIYPAFYFCTAVQTVVYALRFGKYPGVPSPLHLFLVDASFLSSYFMGLSAHTWSLAIEEHFYFLLPLFLLALIKLHPKKRDPFTPIPIVFLIIAIGSLALRIAARPTSPVDYYHYLFPTHLRMDGLFCGVMVGYLYHFRQQFLIRLARWPLLVAGCMLLTPMYYMNVEYWHMYTWGLTCTYLGFACVMIWAIHVPYRQGHLLTFPVEALARIGFYSYSIYLWHWLVVFYLRPYVRSKCVTIGSPFAWSSTLQTWQWPASVVLCIVVGIGMAIIVEQPFLRLRDRWFPSRTRAI
jgi:peptidoglycan/LPS O-acetylase OafA/YrhL